MFVNNAPSRVSPERVGGAVEAPSNPLSKVLSESKSTENDVRTARNGHVHRLATMNNAARILCFMVFYPRELMWAHDFRKRNLPSHVSITRSQSLFQY